MRVLHVVGGLAPRYGGPSVVVPEMARALADRGHDVEIFTTDIDGNRRLQVPKAQPTNWQGIETTFFRVHFPRGYAASLDLAMALKRQVGQFDVVHVHNLYLFHTSVAGRLCRRLDLPYVLSPHGVLDPYHRRQHRWRKAIYSALMEQHTIDGAAFLHFASTTEREHAAALGHETRGVVIPLGVDGVVLNRSPGADELFGHWPQLAGRTLITYVGRLARKKRLDTLIGAFAALASRHPQAQLVIAGPDEDRMRSQLSVQVSKLGLESRVSFLGLVTGDMKAALLQHSYVFPLASEDESFGVSVVEAMAVGLPVIVTKGVAVYPEIAAATAGLVIPLNEEALGGALSFLLDSPRVAAVMGERGRTLVQSTYTWNVIGTELESMYRRATQNRKPRPSRGRRAVDEGIL